MKSYMMPAFILFSFYLYTCLIEILFKKSLTKIPERIPVFTKKQRFNGENLIFFIISCKIAKYSPKTKIDYA